ncbi:MAG TPA: SsrA-binding protein [Phycisphaerales bacterium]|nr:SsrA-binding protein [Phycisphaerales bacterium]
MAKSSEQPVRGPRIANRKARHDYDIVEVVECGLELVGTEVKSLRAGQAKIDEAYARVRGGEVFLVGATISPYPQAAEAMQHDPTRDRRLLLHRRQIAQLESHVKQKGKTLIPLAVYFKNGWAKCEIGVAVGKKQHDKRQDLRTRDHQREIAREMRRRNR